MTRTLADMSPDECADCVGRWATYHGSVDPRPVIIWAVEGDTVWRLSHTSRHEIMGTDLDQITPRFDLPRAWTPEGKPVPGTWDDDNGHNSMRRFQSEWEWKHDTPQHIIDQHTKVTP